MFVSSQIADKAADADKTVDDCSKAQDSAFDPDATMDDTDPISHIAELQRESLMLATAALVCFFLIVLQNAYAC